jgi:hypothetical protein
MTSDMNTALVNASHVGLFYLNDIKCLRGKTSFWLKENITCGRKAIEKLVYCFGCAAELIY